MKSGKATWILAGAMIWLTGCATRSAMTGHAGSDAAADIATVQAGRYATEKLRQDELDDPASPLARRTIYFQYDSDDILPEYRSVVTAHAAYLAAHPQVNLLLEGHADERGSSEYNIALGEQRTQAVSKMMQLQGVEPSQLRMVSYGEEKPAVPGHDEADWQKNRRVELVYPNR